MNQSLSCVLAPRVEISLTMYKVPFHYLSKAYAYTCNPIKYLNNSCTKNTVGIYLANKPSKKKVTEMSY